MNLSDGENKIGVVGAGLIGLSWAGLFSAFGCDTVVYDPNLKKTKIGFQEIKDIWKSLDLLFDNLQNKSEVKFSDKFDDLKGVTFYSRKLSRRPYFKTEINFGARKNYFG